MRDVVAIAAPIGGGKTTFVQALARKLGGAATIHFDRYEVETRRPVSRLRQWLDNGADFSAFEAPNLARDLKRFRFDAPSVDDTEKGENPSGIVLFEMPLGRLHAETAPYIDWVIWIDVPLDVALARKIREYIAWFREDDSENGWIWLDNFLANYLRVFREVLLRQRREVRASADLVLDGMEPPERLLDRAAESIRAIRG